MADAVVSRGGNFQVTLKAAATYTSTNKHVPVYLSAAGQITACSTLTNRPVIGTLADASAGGAGSSVLVNLFSPTHVGKATDAITAGAWIGVASAASGFVTYNTGTNLAPCGFAISSTSLTSELFEFIPLLAYATMA